MSNHPLRDLQAAARAALRHVAPGSLPGEVVVKDQHGHRVISLLIPPTDPTDPAEPADPQPERPGWDFSRGCRLDGALVPIRGRPLDVLRMLAESPGPVPAEQLKKAWTEYEPSDSTVRYQVGELRKVLAKLFPGFEGDIVEATGGGYLLHLR